MYDYKYDSETGGLLLTDKTPLISKEPRPVYSAELDILGFDKYWKYERQDFAPYLWAEANFYFYRGIRVAKINGGSLYEKPEIQLERDEFGNEMLAIGSTLTPVNIDEMVRKNALLMSVLEKQTIKRIFDVYNRYKDKLDCFYVAFSGGKDSIVLLNLVQNALPHNAFMVLFGDTGMEFPDTYDVVSKIEKQCNEESIAFYRAASHFKPEESWRLFGPPSRVLRWCCSVHKATPQILKIREILGKKNYSGVSFVGVRGAESATRSKYDYEMIGKKVEGQRSFNAILEWSSAEIWLYIFEKRLIINRAYILGNQRVGCVFCPMSLKTDYLKKQCYPEIVEKFERIVLQHYDEEQIKNGYWCARTDGSKLQINEQKIFEKENAEGKEFEVCNNSFDFLEWLKTLENIKVNFNFHHRNNGFNISIPHSDSRDEQKKIGLLKTIIRKSAYCVKCRVCEANCSNGCISFVNGLRIDDCKHCQQCNQLPDGCLMYNSLKYSLTKGTSKMVDCFNTHAPKAEWFSDFFQRKTDFLKDSKLGPEQIVRFRRFLRASNLIVSDKLTEFAYLIERIGWNSDVAWELILCNLAYNPQMVWYIKNLELGRKYSRQEVIDMLVQQGNSVISSKNVAVAFRRISLLPLGTKLNFGQIENNGKILEFITRTKMITPDNRVVLFSLFKFAEACDKYHEFTLSRLMDFTVESDGVSPAEIFSLSVDEMEQILHGLAHSYPDYISFTMTHDLDVIHLSEDKTPEMVLELF